MRSTRARTAVAALLGIALHLLVLASLPRTPNARGEQTKQAASTIDFAVSAPRDEPRIEPTQLAIAETQPSEEHAKHAARAKKPIIATATAVPADQPEPRTPSAEAASSTPETARAIDLSPRAAALGALPPSPTALVDSPDDRAALRSAQLSADLGRAAKADVDALLKHRKLELSREPDGTCHYAGDAIDATILPDGGVQFADKAAKSEVKLGVDEPPARPVTMEDRIAPQELRAGMKVTPRAWQAERDWFLRESAPIRQGLADATHARELQTDARDLRKQLDRVWCDESRPKPERRRAIFDLWADTSSDEIGARGRALILEYVRRNLPAGSADAYSGAELAQLNLDRAGSDRFAPYSAVGDRDAGVAR